MSDDKTTIEIMQDGPFIVDNLKVLENSKSENIDIKQKIALCRCGASENRPFCDGTHSKIGFSGKRDSNVKLTLDKSYKGGEITVFYNAALCYHAAECVGNLPAVFDVNSKPWINPDNSDKESIINTIKKCPSGALSYKVGDEHTREFGLDEKIIIEKNGPYSVCGKIELKIEEDLKPPARDHYGLCRCGASKNKPYCDGSHAKVNFKDEIN